MAKRQSHPRIQGQLTHGAGVWARNAIGPVEAHERNVLAITRRIHVLERKSRDLKVQLAGVRDELRAKRRELRAVLQRDSRVTEDQLETAGQADAIDAAEHRREQD